MLNRVSDYRRRDTPVLHLTTAGSGTANPCCCPSSRSGTGRVEKGDINDIGTGRSENQ
jgi:hypothetical protein